MAQTDLISPLRDPPSTESTLLPARPTGLRLAEMKQPFQLFSDRGKSFFPGVEPFISFQQNSIQDLSTREKSKVCLGATWELIQKAFQSSIIL